VALPYEAPMIVYFDTNVFDHLEQRLGVSDRDVFRLERAIELEHVRLILSFLNIEEILFIAESKPERAMAQLGLILKLADKRLFVRGQDEIIRSDIRAYAQQKPYQTPFTTLTPDVESDILDMMDLPTCHREDFDRIIGEARQDKETFLETCLKGQKKLKPMAAEIGIKQYPFPLYLTHNSGWVLEGLAQRAGALSSVKRRGITGLLNVKSVAVAVGAHLSLLYAQHFDGHAPSPGDSRDTLHAVLASTGQVFVTNDGKLEKILSRLRIEDFRVMSLRNFLDDLPQWI
jgi:hypothetical protein